jgi:hypothetical protein
MQRGPSAPIGALQIRADSLGIYSRNDDRRGASQNKAMLRLPATDADQSSDVSIFRTFRSRARGVIVRSSARRRTAIVPLTEVSACRAATAQSNRAVGTMRKGPNFPRRPFRNPPPRATPLEAGLFHVRAGLLIQTVECPMTMEASMPQGSRHRRIRGNLDSPALPCGERGRE